MDSVVSVTGTQFCCRQVKTAADDMRRNGCGNVPVKLYENGQLAVACQFLSKPRLPVLF